MTATSKDMIELQARIVWETLQRDGTALHTGPAGNWLVAEGRRYRIPDAVIQFLIDHNLIAEDTIH